MKTLITRLIPGLLVLVAATNACAINFQFVVVGNPGNAGDSNDGGFLLGPVAEEFSIAKTEVTIGQWAEFLNAVADDDPNGLWDTSMGNGQFVGHITRTGSSSSYVYQVAAGENPNLPITHVSYYDSLRFMNWLENGQPVGPQGAGTTEDGSYTFSGTTTVGALNPGSLFFMPTENQWYKAAYHQPASEGGDSDNFWLFPFQTNDQPFSDDPTALNTPDDSRAANVFINDFNGSNGFDDGFATTGSTSISGSELYLTPVGAYGSATSYYGAFDMGGNVGEWVDTIISQDWRGIRGGAWNNLISALESKSRGSGVQPFGDWNHVGIRVATSIIPEPSRALLSLLGLCGVLVRRRR